jgi:hypothetical protein
MKPQLDKQVLACFLLVFMMTPTLTLCDTANSVHIVKCEVVVGAPLKPTRVIGANVLESMHHCHVHVTLGELDCIKYQAIVTAAALTKRFVKYFLVSNIAADIIWCCIDIVRLVVLMYMPLSFHILLGLPPVSKMAVSCRLLVSRLKECKTEASVNFPLLLQASMYFSVFSR